MPDELFQSGRKALADAHDDKAKVAVACEMFDEAAERALDSVVVARTFFLHGDEISNYLFGLAKAPNE